MDGRADRHHHGYADRDTLPDLDADPYGDGYLYAHVHGHADGDPDSLTHAE